MPYQVLAPEAQPCVWMCAGVIRYRLCERGYDCDNCPLDAALRGTLAPAAQRAPSLEPSTGVHSFPDDRLYAPGHLWVMAHALEDTRVWRLGLDAFAAAIVGCTLRVSGPVVSTTLLRGDPMCAIDLGMGTLTLRAPLAGSVARSNETLRLDPRRAVTDPYGEGWLVEIAGLDAGAILKFDAAARAAAGAAEDLRRFRRTLALRLLSETSAAPDPLADLRQILGGPRYLELVAQFVH